MHYLIEVSICTLLFFIPFLVFFKGKKNHKSNRFFLLSALVFSFIIPLIEIPLWTEYVSIPVITDIPAVPILNDVSPIKSCWSLGQIISLLYFFGLFIQLSILGIGLINIWKIVRNGEIVRGQRFTKVYTSENSQLSSFWHFIFIPKARQKDVTDYELRHEFCHIRQKHTNDVLFVELVKAVLWFNPVVYFLKKELIGLHEFLADDHCINQFGQSKYQSFLIQQVAISHKPVLVHTFNALIKKRIQMINSSKEISKWKYLLFVPVTFIGCTLFSFTNATVYEYEKPVSTLEQDTMIPTGIRLSAFMDTVVTFDPATGKESVEVIKRKISYSNESTPIDYSRIAIDTVITFDPATGEENVQIVKYVVEGKVNPEIINDTVTIVNSITKKQKIYVVPSAGDVGTNSKVESINAIDTVTIFDPNTYKETQVSINTVTGVVDTLYKDKQPKKVIIKN